jgi:hypothetical protein
MTTNLHLRVVGNGLPVSVELSPGQLNDQPTAEIVLNDRPAGAAVIVDKGYDADLIEDQDCTPHIHRNPTDTTASPIAGASTGSAI